MTTVATFRLESDQFPLGSVFTNLPEATVQLERVIPGANGVVPYFWVRGVESEAIVDQFSAHPGVKEIEHVDDVDGEYLLRCRWPSDYDGVLDALVEPDIVLLSAVGTAEEWTFEVRGESRSSIDTFYRRCQDRGVPVSLSVVHALRPVEERHNLTEKQREAVRLAFERGYYDSPRMVTLETVAEELDITPQALASRLRRGTRRLIDMGLIKDYS